MAFNWQDMSIRILALLVAVLLWVYVTNEQNPVTDQTYNIPLVMEDKPPGYVVEGLPKAVNIRVKGTMSVISTLKKENFKARVKLFDTGTGEQELPVEVSTPPGIELLQVIPQVVRVNVDKVVEKTVPVSVSLKGDVQDGMQAGEPVLKPPVVVIEGPSKILAKIDQVGVTVDVSGADDTLEREMAVDTGIDAVTVRPGLVAVTVPVTELPSKRLPVRIRLSGQPAAGYVVGQTAVQPSSVQVVAREEVLQGLTAVSTMQVDITGIAADVERDVALVLPDGAKSVHPDRVSITVRIFPAAGREQENPPPSGNEETMTQPPAEHGTGNAGMPDVPGEE